MHISEVGGQAPKRLCGSTWLRWQGTRLRMNANSASLVLDGEQGNYCFHKGHALFFSHALSKKNQLIQTTDARSVLPFACV